MNFQLPPMGTFLYKYLSPDNLDRVLSSRKVRFSPLIEFNDPFEINTYPVETFTELEFGHALANEIYEVLQTGEEISGTGPIIDFITAYRNGALREISHHDLAIYLGNEMAMKKFVPTPSPYTRVIHKRLSKLMGAFCLSETYENLLMWAHYASNHEGFVLGLDPSRVGRAFSAMAPVVYSDSYPTKTCPRQAASRYLGRIRSTADADQDPIERMFFTKSLDWKYEREWRAIRSHHCDFTADHKTYDINTQLEEIPKDAFVSLYLGCRCNPEVAAKQVIAIKAINPDILIFKSRPSARSFSLEFQPYDEPWPNLYPPEDQVM